MKVRNTRELAAVARAHRRKLGWSQAHTAGEAGVSREWLIEFEKAKSTVELGMVLRLLRVLGLGIQIEDTPDNKSVGSRSVKSAPITQPGRRQA